MTDATEALARAHALREAFRQLKQGENVGYDLPRYLAALGYEVRAIAPPTLSGNHKPNKVVIHSVTAEAAGEAAEEERALAQAHATGSDPWSSPEPAAADLDVEALKQAIHNTECGYASHIAGEDSIDPDPCGFRARGVLGPALAALGYEVRPIDPDPGSDQYEAGWKAGWADRDRHPTPIHSVTAEAADREAAGNQYGGVARPSAAADSHVEALARSDIRRQQEAVDLFRRYGFVFDNTGKGGGKRWEKLAFTLYGYIVESSEEARQAIEQAAEAKTRVATVPAESESAVASAAADSPCCDCLCGNCGAAYAAAKREAGT